MSTEGITVDEGAVAILDGVSVGVANLWKREYETADGMRQTGPSVILYLDDDRSFTVGEGSAFDIDGNTWVVAAIAEGPRRAKVTFTRG